MTFDGNWSLTFMVCWLEMLRSIFIRWVWLKMRNEETLRMY